MRRRALLFVLLLTGVAVAPGCGDEEADAKKGADGSNAGEGGKIPTACGVKKIDPRPRGMPIPLPGLFFAQEIWLSYRSKDGEAKADAAKAHKGYRFRYPRTRAEALDKARKLCARVHAGEEIGLLARRWSNAAWAIAHGLAAAPEPANRPNPDARDVALYQTRIGKITPLIEWRGGFWFARRVGPKKAGELEIELRRATKVRARARVIHIHHFGAFPRRHEFDNFTKKQAVQKAWAIIAEIQRGVSFESLAMKHCNDKNARARAGLLVTKDPRTGKQTDWVQWGDRNFNQPMLDVILEKGESGKLWPEPVISGQGVDVVLLLERREN